jgi:rhodanese-related sulfurtransferase
MNARTLRTTLVVAALGLGVASAALAGRSAGPGAPAGTGPRPIDPFAVAALLAEGPPDAVVVLLDGAPRHALRGAVPAATFGEGDDAFVASAPKARRIVLVGADVVHVDRVARKLTAAGRDVRALVGGLGSWDTAMDADPEPPAPGATADTWAAYRTRVALRRSFGDAAAAPAQAVVAPVAPAAAPAGGGGAKKREGC